MRFFDAGVEVALDGSPVPDNEAPSPPPTPLSETSWAGRLAFPADVQNASGGPSGVTVSGTMRGLAKFSMGERRAPGSDNRVLTTPSESLPRDVADTDE